MMNDRIKQTVDRTQAVMERSVTMRFYCISFKELGSSHSKADLDTFRVQYTQPHGMEAKMGFCTIQLRSQR